MARISYDNQAKQNVRYLIDFAQKKLYLDENDSLYLGLPSRTRAKLKAMRYTEYCPRFATMPCAKKS